jgi:hypothetical protein
LAACAAAGHGANAANVRGQGTSGVASLSGAATRRLPPQVIAWLRQRRRSVVRRSTGVDIEGAAGDIESIRHDVAGALEQHRHDLLARHDTVLAGYDRRVAALVNRVLDIEERIGGEAPDPLAGIGAHVTRPAALLARVRACIEPDPDEARILAERVAMHLPLLKEHAPVVHVGGGSGVLALLRDAGVEAAGLGDHDDPMSGLAQRPEASAGAVMIVALIEGLALDDVDRLLRVATRVVRNGGVVVVEARYPATPESLARFWRDPSHLRPWDAATVSCLARHAGLEVPEVRAHPGPDADFALVARRP